MKKVQILTDESVATLRRAVIALNLLKGFLESDTLTPTIAELNEIIKDVTE